VKLLGFSRGSGWDGIQTVGPRSKANGSFLKPVAVADAMFRGQRRGGERVLLSLR
jgi:hypothetical protein